MFTLVFYLRIPPLIMLKLCRPFTTKVLNIFCTNYICMMETKWRPKELKAVEIKYTTLFLLRLRNKLWGKPHERFACKPPCHNSACGLVSSPRPVTITITVDGPLKRGL